jgi:hypothetical protein
MGMVDRSSVGRTDAVKEEVKSMPFSELSGELGELGEPRLLGPPIYGDPGCQTDSMGRTLCADPAIIGQDTSSSYDLRNFILPKKKHRGMYGIPGGYPGPMPADDPGATIPGGTPGPVSFGNDMGTPGTVPAATTSPLGSFDLSSLFSGNIMGIPTWIILAAAAYFLFFKKGR